MEIKEILTVFEELSVSLKNLHKILHLEEKPKLVAEKEQLTLAPDFWNNTERAKKISKELDLLKTDISAYQNLAKNLEDNKALFELVQEMQDEAELKNLENNLKTLKEDFARL